MTPNWKWRGQASTFPLSLSRHINLSKLHTFPAPLSLLEKEEFYTGLLRSLLPLNCTQIPQYVFKSCCFSWPPCFSSLVSNYFPREYIHIILYLKSISGTKFGILLYRVWAPQFHPLSHLFIFLTSQVLGKGWVYLSSYLQSFCTCLI